MYRKKNPNQTELELPFGIPLNPDSKWVKLAKLMPWDRIEEEYQNKFKGNEGQEAKSSRLAFGALYIQMTEGLSDERTREHIRDNPHMQYFCGFPGYTTEPPFDSSLMVYFRKRITHEMIKAINEEV